MRAVDTNVLVRLITRDDLKQATDAEAFVMQSGGWVGVLEIARKAGHLPIGTFDRQFARLAGAQQI